MADEVGSVLNLEDIQRMKVAELKKELKARGLPISGNKTELVERLQEAVDVPKLDNSGSEDQIVSECLEGLENLDGTDEVNEDEVLSDDVLYSEENKVSESQEINEEDILAPSSQPETVIPVKSAVKLHRKPLPILDETAQIDLEADSEKANEVKQEEINEHVVIADGEKKVVSMSTKTMTQEERLAMRAKKFSNGTADKLKVRAERFGTPASKENSVKPTTEKISSSPIDLSCLKKRAERFGQSVSSVMKQIEEKSKILKRKERFGTPVSTPNSTEQIEEKSKVLKRKERFGATLATDTSEQERKKKRAERFNL